MNNTVSSKSGFEFTGKHMLALMLCFFGVIIAVNFFMATLASQSWTGLVVKNSYVASQKFNAELEQAQVQTIRGWKSKVLYNSGTLILMLRDKENNLLQFEKVTAEIGRPAFEQEDKKLDFMPLPAGGNKIAIDLKVGIWALKIMGVVEGQNYRRDVRINVDANGKGTVL